MKRLMAMVAMVGLLVGCMTPEQKQWTCETAQNAYAAYQAVIEAGHTPSQEEIYAATAAATFLRLWCGWTVEDVQVRVMSAGATVVYDANLVPRIAAPTR